MRPNKEACAPVYYEPEIMKYLALRKLDELQNHQPSVPWIANSSVFLKEDGSFSDFLIEERSFRLSTKKAFLSMNRLFSARARNASKEEQTLRIARRRLLVSLLAHAWLWERPKVLDAGRKHVAFKQRRVLAPQDILDFLGKVRARKASCTYGEVQHLLQHGIRRIYLHQDKSKWYMVGVIACLKWDKSHDITGEGPWCSCRLERKGSPPPYHEVFRAKESLQSPVSPLDSGVGLLVTAQKGKEKYRT